MAQFSIATATLSLGGTSYCASDVNLTHTTEALTFQCMSTTNPVTFAGLESWSGTCTLAYEDTGMDQLWGLNGALSFVVTKSTTGTITFAGNVQITEVSAPFNNGELPQVSVSFVSNGAITEVVA